MEAIETKQANIIIQFVDSYWIDLFNRMENLRSNLDQFEQRLTNNNNTKTQ